MRASLSLHLSLFRRQKAQISRAVEGSSRSFRAYEARYRRRTGSYERALSFGQVSARVNEADVVYVGDYHTLRLAQRSFLALARSAVESGRRVVLALELIEGRHQGALDDWLRRRLGDRAFLARIGHAYTGAFDIWPNFKPILEFAREERLAVVGIDRRARGRSSLAVRDRYAAARIAHIAAAPDRPLVLALVGQNHVTPSHLPCQVRRRLEVERRHLVVYQNCEGIYWKLARAGQTEKVEAVQVREGELCLMNASPVVCQQSFLDYLEAEEGDASLLDRGAPGRFGELARLIGRFAGVNVREALAEVEVATAADLDFLARAKRRGRFGPGELAQLRRQVLSRESYYIPRARMAYLATLSLNHAAEEAAHFVRHASVGEALELPRAPGEAFYARCLEEALGFFGSKLANPRRRCRDLAEWAQVFESRHGEERQVAAFVLAHKAAEKEGKTGAASLLPRGKGRLFHAVSHALGYLLGEALYRAFDEGRCDRAELRELFREDFDEPIGRYFELASRLGA